MSMILMIGIFALVFYLFIYRPQKKQEKETADMRNSIDVGDVIVTVGGIVAMVVKVKGDMVLCETSGNRTKIQIQKWAVSSVLEKANEPEVKEATVVKPAKTKEEKKARKEKKIK
ncbi:MAG: preprotein translocase subunit YajC [Clostridia bacterium]|jgi:preprotein translocase subunit YajC|nr:preprotein translocase subunit YajC [Clostridia bacterium]MBR5277732.1 preprotein translocase subunit YajC [Clostridia bacterium]